MVRRENEIIRLQFYFKRVEKNRLWSGYNDS